MENRVANTGSGMIKTHMTISEYVIDPDHRLTAEEATKIQVYHANPMGYVRHLLEHPIRVSKNSGIRTLQWEIGRKRSGITEHLFKPLDRPGSEKGLGAADYTTELHSMPRMFELMIEYAGYSRIAFYPDANHPFGHADHRFEFEQTRLYAVRGGSWTQVSKEVFFTQVTETIKARTA